MDAKWSTYSPFWAHPGWRPTGASCRNVSACRMCVDTFICLVSLVGLAFGDPFTVTELISLGDRVVPVGGGINWRWGHLVNCSFFYVQLINRAIYKILP